MAIEIVCSSIGMCAVNSRVFGETLTVKGGERVSCEGAQSLMVRSSEAIMRGEI